MASKYFKKALSQTSEVSKKFVEKNLDITDWVHSIMKRKGMSQKDLADVLGKKEPEVSRMLSGLHNFTLRSLVRLEVALGEEVLTVPSEAEPVPLQGPVISFSKSSRKQQTNFSFERPFRQDQGKQAFKEAKVISFGQQQQEEAFKTEAI